MTSFTLVSFHAHPDDESLLTGGTLARAAAEGHRVVLVTATRGEQGLAGAEDGRGAALATLRTAELEAAAAALGCARVVCLGYGDSGTHPDPDDAGAFVHADLETAATRLAEVLREERADVLTVYDRHGGYGHPDHVRVHQVGTRAAHLAGTPVVLEATVPAGPFRAALALQRVVGGALGRSTQTGATEVFSRGHDISHRVRVTHVMSAKRAALAAHASQQRADGQPRLLAALLRLPRPVFDRVLGHEWFVEQGRPAGPRSDDVFASLRAAPSPGEAA